MMSEGSSTIFQAILGSAFGKLPPALKAFHSDSADRIWTGKAETFAASSPIAKLVAGLFGFPDTSGKILASVSIITHKNSERWTRNFDGNKFISILRPGSGRNQHLMVEQFGYIKFSVALAWKDKKLWFIPQNWSIWGIPLPRFLMPGGDSFEYEKDGRFHFNVNIEAPLIGRLASYRGWLEPPNQTPSPDNHPPASR